MEFMNTFLTGLETANAKVYFQHEFAMAGFDSHLLDKVNCNFTFFR